MKNTNKREIKVEWCENWIRAQFTKHHAFPNGGGIETNCFWDKAEASGLWKRGTYGSAMSQALGNITKLETVTNAAGEFLYNVFRLA